MKTQDDLAIAHQEAFDRLVVELAAALNVDSDALRASGHLVVKGVDIGLLDVDVFHDARDQSHADLGSSASSSSAVEEEEVFHDASGELQEQSSTPTGALPPSVEVTAENDGQITKLRGHARGLVARLDVQDLPALRASRALRGMASMENSVHQIAVRSDWPGCVQV